jgi:hypothetical protein
MQTMILPGPGNWGRRLHLTLGALLSFVYAKTAEGDILGSSEYLLVLLKMVDL